MAPADNQVELQKIIEAAWESRDTVSFDTKGPVRDAVETALDLLEEAVGRADVLVPGHGAVAVGPEVVARLAADRAYVDALRRGDEPVDERLSQDWLTGIHQSNLEQARGS